MLTRSELDTFTKDLEENFSFSFVSPDNALRETAISFLKFLATLVPGSSVAVDALLKHLDQWSSTFPLPFGTVCLLSKRAVSDPLMEVRTKVHEATHAFQIKEAGGIQAAVDYLGSGNLRAMRESSACVAALWVEYLLTGNLPNAVAATNSLRQDLYHLDKGEADLAVGNAQYAINGILSKVVPPYAVAISTLRWLRINAPSKIVPGWCQVIEVPS